MKTIRILFALPLLFVQLAVSGQDFSNKGTDFWLGYGYHVNMAGNPTGGGTQDMKLYFTSDKNATVKVDIPGIGYSVTYTVTANQVTISNPIPKAGTQDARINSVGKFDRGIHITSDVPVVAYAHIYNQSVSGASLLFPTNTLGKDYYSVNYTQASNATNANSFFFVVATEDNTTVEITPSAANVNGLAVGVATNISLNKGQVYNVMGTVNGVVGTDLTGSRIRSISTGGAGGCKRIAVFSGAGKMSIGGANGGNAGGSADNLFAQAFPSVAWGKKYLTVPTGTQPNNFYRVCVSDPKTIVKLNGTVLPASSLINNFYYQFKNNNASGNNSPAVPNLIESDLPIMVAQYCTTQGVEGNTAGVGGDPEMIYLSPVEQTINNITLYSSGQFMINQSYVNVVIKTGGVSSFKLDGAGVSSFAVHPQDNNYSYAILTVSAGPHTLYSDTGFNAIAYGFGAAESYGYNAGTSIRDFTPSTTFQNPYSRIDSAVTCVNTQLQFSVPLSYTPVSIKWDFSAAPNISPSATIGPAAPNAPDSTKLIGGQTISYYSTGKTFTFTNANSASARDTIKLYTTSATPDGCGSNEQLITIPVKVIERPAAKFVAATTGCVSDSVLFTDQSTYASGTLKKWLWNFGDGTNDERSAPAAFPKKYTTGNTYVVKLKTISDVGCISDEVSQSVEINDKPVAKFNFPVVTCAESDIIFTDVSTSTTGTITKWTWNLDDGAAAFTNTTNASAKTKYAVYGTKSPTLTVETATGCKSDVFTATNFKVNPLPEVKFGIPEVCLSDANAPFTDSTRIAEGSIASYLWNFNAGTPAVSPGPNITTSTAMNPQVKYNKSDNYVVSLQVTSAASCVAVTSLAFTVNGSIPKSDFVIANTVPYCGTRAVQLKNQSTVDFGNVTKLDIYWDHANAPTVKETIDVPVSGRIYPHSYPDPSSPKQYTIRMVAYSGGSACSNFSEKTITVYPLPKAAFNVSASQLCFGDVVNFTDKSNGMSSAATSWQWNLGKGALSNAQNPVQQYNDSGLIDVSLHFTNGDGCLSDTAVKTLTIYPNPKLTLKHNELVLSGGTIALIPQYVYGNQLQYLWTPATYLSSDTSVAPKSTPDDDIRYRLTLTAQGGCTASDTVFITVLKGPVVPNVFSPNGDGINDTWRIKYLESYVGATVEVYNRSGQIVYRSTGYATDWDGTYKGSPLPVGTYYYIINPKNSRPIVTGSVTIIK